MRRAGPASVGWLLLTLLALTSCGGDPKLATVSGAVTLDDNPVATGTIMFIPANGNARTTGGPIKDGRYSVQAPLGVMKVSLSAPKVVGTKKIYPTANSPVMPVTIEAIPAKYNEQTELSIEVTARGNKQDFHVKSK